MKKKSKKGAMAPELRAYLDRLKSYIKGKDPMALLKSAPGRLEKLVKTMKTAELKRRPAKGKWSIHEQIGHMADVESAFGWRFRRAIGEPGKGVEGFDQDAWAEKMEYRKMPAKALLESYKALRTANVHLLTHAPKKAREGGYIVHPERGRQTVETQATLLAGHDVNHLLQMQNIRAKFQKKASGQQSRNQTGLRRPVRKAKKD